MSRETKRETMKHLKTILVSILLALSLAACSLSTEDLVTEVKKSMEEKFKGKGITIKSLMLTKKGGNIYSGLLETKEPNGEFTYTVEVIYDGNNMQWEVESSHNN
jgi:hypothetical protein